MSENNAIVLDCVAEAFVLGIVGASLILLPALVIGSEPLIEIGWFLAMFPLCYAALCCRIYMEEYWEDEEE